MRVVERETAKAIHTKLRREMKKKEEEELNIDI